MGALNISGTDHCHAPENAKDTLCRNVTIYGRCRYEDKGMTERARIDVQVLIHNCCLFRVRI
jgi:hypothetical protein